MTKPLRYAVYRKEHVPTDYTGSAFPIRLVLHGVYDRKLAKVVLSNLRFQGLKGTIVSHGEFDHG